MRLYHIAEARGRRCYVWSATGVDVERWNDIVREVRDWRLRLRERYGIALATELHPLGMVMPPSPVGDRGSRRTVSREAGVKILRSALRLIEREAGAGGIEVINVCLPGARGTRAAEVGLGRLLTRINTSVTAANRHAFVIFDDSRQAQVARLYRRFRVHNPIPSRFDCWEDGAPTLNLPIDAVIGGPVFRSARTDHLLQLARFVSRALVLQEDLTGWVRGGDAELAGAFSILDRALNREASDRDPQGIVRR